MKRSKLLSILFIVVFALTLSLSVSATGLEETYDLSFTVEASASTVSYNDTFTITVNLDKNNGFITAKALLNYDPTKVAFVGADVSNSVITKADGKIATTTSDNGDNITIMMGEAGDLFTGTLAGGLTRGLPMQKALAVAADFVRECILQTQAHPQGAAYGVQFERAIPWLIHRLEEEGR